MFGHLVKRCRMPTSTNVWNTHKRCFSYYGIGFLHTVNGMTHWKQYIELLGRRLVPDLYTLFPDWSSIFQYYLPPCHTAKEVNNFFKDNQIKSQQRPENSSDPNHIKKLSMCKQRLRGLHYQGKVDSGLHKSVVQSISSKTAQNWWIQCQIASNHCLRIEQVISCTNWSVLTLFLQKNLHRFLLFFRLFQFAQVCIQFDSWCKIFTRVFFHLIHGKTGQSVWHALIYDNFVGYLNVSTHNVQFTCVCCRFVSGMC